VPDCAAGNRPWAVAERRRIPRASPTAGEAPALIIVKMARDRFSFLERHCLPSAAKDQSRFDCFLVALPPRADLLLRANYLCVPAMMASELPQPFAAPSARLTDQGLSSTTRKRSFVTIAAMSSPMN